MKSIASRALRTALCCGLLTGPALHSLGGVARAGVTFDTAAQTVAHDCGSDPDVTISGSASTVTLTGACAQVSVQGSGNRVVIASADKLAITGSTNEVSIDSVAKISVTGSANQVTWKQGRGGAAPKVSKVGVRNTVRKGK
jgi:Protein of unknown function (DUF3060)